MNIAIIQARGGSKRIPGKNIKDFLGEPIINYPIRVALTCNDIFDHVIVTTDSEKIAKIAKAAGAEVPFMRPAEFADDYTNTLDVIGHAIRATEKVYGRKIKTVCGIYATAPFLRANDIRKGFDLMLSKKSSSVFSVTTFPYPIFRALKINKNNNLEMFWPKYEMTRSNDLDEAYHDAGQFYWLDAQKFLQTKKIFTKDALPVILPRILVQDIDVLEDWETAEILYQVCQKQKLL